MIKSWGYFIVKLVLVAFILWGIHAYLIQQFFTGELYFSLWSIYVFNMLLVILVYGIIQYVSGKYPKKVYQYFLGLTLLKMVLALVFLSPLFFNRSDHSQLEVINFFVPYFLFLGFEIFNLNSFLQKS